MGRRVYLLAANQTYWEEMHTIKGNPYTTFHVNGDFSGDVVIRRFTGEPNQQEMRVPMDALDALFAERIRRKKIAEVEAMSDRSVIREAIDRF
jgi:hypothetical protein